MVSPRPSSINSLIFFWIVSYSCSLGLTRAEALDTAANSVDTAVSSYSFCSCCKQTGCSCSRGTCLHILIVWAFSKVPLKQCQCSFWIHIPYRFSVSITLENACLSWIINGIFNDIEWNQLPYVLNKVMVGYEWKLSISIFIRHLTWIPDSNHKIIKLYSSYYFLILAILGILAVVSR